MVKGDGTLCLMVVWPASTIKQSSRGRVGLLAKRIEHALSTKASYEASCPISTL